MALSVPKAGLAAMLKEGAKVTNYAPPNVTYVLCDIGKISLHVSLLGHVHSLQHFHGLEEAVFRNIHACKELATVTRSSYGPNGM